MNRRLATVDVGSNSVTSLVAEADGAGGFRAVEEAAEITRLGRDLGRTGRLSPQGLKDTLAVLARFAERASTLGAERIVGVATAAAREAEDGASLVEGAARVGVPLRIVGGEEEAALSWRAAWHDFGAAGEKLAVVDVGGRSTEVIVGAGDTFDVRVSLPVGAVRLTEEAGIAGEAPPTDAQRRQVDEAARAALDRLPDGLSARRLVAVAGTATTLAAVHLALPRYDPERVHGVELARAEAGALLDRLWALPLSLRRELPGMEPKRADVLPAGGQLLLRAADRLAVPALTISDRGVRWGLLLAIA